MRTFAIKSISMHWLSVRYLTESFEGKLGGTFYQRNLRRGDWNAKRVDFPLFQSSAAVLESESKWRQRNSEEKRLEVKNLE